MSGAFGVYYLDRYPTVLTTGVIGVSGVGFISTKSGKTYTLQYSVNASGLNGPVRMTLVDGNQTRELFFSNINGSILN